MHAVSALPGCLRKTSYTSCSAANQPVNISMCWSRRRCLQCQPTWTASQTGVDETTVASRERFLLLTGTSRSCMSCCGFGDTAFPCVRYHAHRLCRGTFILFCSSRPRPSQAHENETYLLAEQLDQQVSTLHFLALEAMLVDEHQIELLSSSKAFSDLKERCLPLDETARQARGDNAPSCTRCHARRPCR